jgi:peptidoglycan/LPS O-acetylase OafA/YrhL
MGTQSAPPKEIWPILAGLRFFFATWVIFDHTYNFGLADRAMPIFSLSGLMPVLCFLAISGFSIRHSITTSPIGYFRRRFWRIVPTNIACVGIALAAFSFFHGTLTGAQGEPYAMPGFWTWAVYLIPAQAIVPLLTVILFPSWSLSIEIVYYALAPHLTRTKTVYILGAAVISMALFSSWKLLPAQIAPQYIGNASFGLGAIVFVWAWLAGWIAYSNKNTASLLLLFILIGCICPTAYPDNFALNTYTAVAATYVAWIATITILFLKPRLNLGPSARDVLSYLGEISFPLYLVHYPLWFTLTSLVWGKHPDWNYGILQVAAAICAATAIYQFIDKPLRHVGTSHMRQNAVNTRQALNVQTNGAP